MFPLDLSLPDLVTELLVFLPSPGHHADKETMPYRNLLKILLGSQFAVSHIDEIRSPQKFLQCFVICRMEAVIGLISIVNPVRDRHRTIRRDVEPQDELLQIGAMVFVDAVG